MSLILDGTINGMRPVVGENTYKGGEGTYWHFLSLEVCDSRFGSVYSIQVRQSEKALFDKFVKIEKAKDENGKAIDKSSLKEDWTGHNVKVLIKGASAGERKIKDRDTGAEETILQVRMYASALKDLGMPKADDF